MQQSSDGFAARRQHPRVCAAQRAGRLSPKASTCNSAVKPYFLIAPCRALAATLHLRCSPRLAPTWRRWSQQCFEARLALPLQRSGGSTAFAQIIAIANLTARLRQ